MTLFIQSVDICILQQIFQAFFILDLTYLRGPTTTATTVLHHSIYENMQDVIFVFIDLTGVVHHEEPYYLYVTVAGSYQDWCTRRAFSNEIWIGTVFH